jgi:hypothetical protein
MLEFYKRVVDSKLLTQYINSSQEEEKQSPSKKTKAMILDLLNDDEENKDGKPV